MRCAASSRADGYRKDNRFYEELRWALGDGLLNSQDERWLRQRRFIQPLFTRRRIAGYAQSMAEEAGDLVERWRPWAANGTPVDLHQYFSMLEAVIALAVIAQHYELSSLTERVPLAPRITLHPAAPVPCRLTTRGS